MESGWSLSWARRNRLRWRKARVDLALSHILALCAARIRETSPPSTKKKKKKMGSQCESSHSPENTGPSRVFQNLMRNRCPALCPPLWHGASHSKPAQAQGESRQIKWPACKPIKQAGRTKTKPKPKRRHRAGHLRKAFPLPSSPRTGHLAWKMTLVPGLFWSGFVLNW